MAENVHLTVVSPVYGCAGSIIQLCERLEKILLSITEDFEIILVNDGSPDNSWELIKSLCKEKKEIKGICLSRNFGQHNASFLLHRKYDIPNDLQLLSD